MAVLTALALTSSGAAGSFSLDTNTDWQNGAQSNTTISGDRLKLSKVKIIDNFDDNALDPKWLTADQDGTAGTSFAETQQQLRINANGQDIWNNADEYGAVYRNDVSGNWTTTLDVTYQENTHNWAKSGIVVKNDISTAAGPTGYVVVTVTPGNAVSMQWDSGGDGNLDTNSQACSSTYPVKLRLIKTGTQMEGQCSTDGGSTWTTINTLTGANVPGIQNTQDVGMIVSSHSSGTLAETRFDNWNLTKTTYYDSAQYTSEVINYGNSQIQSWTNITVDAASVPSGTDLDATIQALDTDNTTIDTDLIDLQQGTNNYNIDVAASERARIIFNSTNTDPAAEWSISSSTLNYQPGMELAGELKTINQSTGHAFDISAVATHSGGDSQISGCEVYYRPKGLSWNSFSETPNTGFGDSQEASCNSTIDTSLQGVGYIQDGVIDPSETVDYRIEFTGSNGITASTGNQTNTLPNNEPVIESIDDTISSDSHSFTFTSDASDQDGDVDFASCQIIAEDQNGNKETLSGLNTSIGDGDTAECSASIDDSINGFEVGESISVLSRFTDITGAQAESTTTSYEIPNHAPTFDSITSTQSTDSHNFDVTAQFSPIDRMSDLTNGQCTAFINDGDGNSVTRTVTPTDNGATAQCEFTAIGSSISGFEVNEEINVKVEAEDEFGAAVNSSIQSETIPNRAPNTPGAPQLEVPDTNNVVNHSFPINWSNPSDTEGDEINVRAYVGTGTDPSNLDNSVVVSGSNSELILGNSVELLDGTSYNIELEACDNWSCSSRTSSKSFRMNEEPSINDAGSSTAPADLTGGDNTDIFADITDSNSAVKWTTFNVWNTTSNTQVLDENISTAVTDNYWNSSDFSVNQDTSYNWSVETSDGFETSTQSGTFTTGSASPEIVSGLQFYDYSNSHKFDISMVARDGDTDDDLQSADLHLSDGDGNNYVYEANIDRTYGDGNEANITYSNINSSIQGFKVGESISAYIQVSDGNSTVSTSTVSHSIPNRAPQVSNINIEPAGPETNETLNVTYDLSDPEGDVINANYEWSIVGSSSIITSRAVSPESTTEGDEWNVSVTPVDEYGLSGSSQAAGSTVTVQNTVPSIINSISFNNLTDHRFEVTAAAEDINGQTDVSSCTVSVNQSANSATVSGSSLDTTFGDADEVKCSAVVYPSNYSWMKPLEEVTVDAEFSDESNTVTTSGSNVVPNEKPSVSLDVPLNANLSSNPVNFSWTGSDPDGDSLEYDVEVFNNGSVWSDTGLTTGSSSTVLSDGEYDWNVAVRDINSSKTLSTAYSSTGSFLLDTTPPVKQVSGINVSNSSQSNPDQNDSVDIYSQWKDNFDLDRVVVYDNQTDSNQTFTGLENGWANKTLNSSDLKAGYVTYTSYAFDHLGNSETISGSFNVHDIEAPVISGFSVNPNSQANFDPGKKIYVNASALDNVGVTNVDLQYRKNTSNTWNTKDMNYKQSIYQSNFTPSTEGTYEFRVLAEDTAGNNATVSDTQLVETDTNWFISPTSLGSNKRSTLDNNNIGFQKIVIENNGDVQIDYSISVAEKGSSNLKIEINNTNPVIPPGESKAVKVNASLIDSNLEEGLTSTFSLDVTTSASKTPEPVSESVSGLARFIQDGPYIEIREGISFPAVVTQEDSDVVFSTIIENIGTDAANNTRISYSFPDDWTASRTSYSIGNLSAGSSQTNQTTVDISANATTGTRTVLVTVEEAERTFNASFDVSVIEKQENNTEIIEEGGGGGGPAGPSGPTSQEQVEQQTDQIFNTTESFEIVRGQDQNFTLGFQNPTEYNLTNITANVEGIQSQYVSIANPDLGRVNINESENITVLITAPEYFQTGDYTLEFNITGKGIDDFGAFADYFDFTLNKQVELGVRAIPEENASELVNQTRDFVSELENSNMSTGDIESLVADAENNLEQGDYGQVQEIYQEARSRYQTARDVRQGLQELEKQINSAEASGLDVGRARQVASLAEAAMERGAYTTAAERLDEARSIYQLETAGEVNWIYEIRSNWKKILAGIIFISVAGFLTRLRYRLYKIRSRLKDLESKEKSIEDLKLQKQKKAFEDKEISLSEYEDSIEDYNDQIIDIIEERVELQAEEANISNFKRRDSLAQERDQLNQLIKETQQDYVEGNISDTDVYEKKVEELTNRLSEIEGEIAEIDAEAEVRSESTIGRIMEKIPIISSGGKTQ